MYFRIARFGRCGCAARTGGSSFKKYFDFLRLSCLGLPAVLLSCASRAATIPISNPSFETTGGTPMSGWSVQPSDSTEAYIYSPTEGAAGSDYPGGIPDGTNVAHSDGPIIFQDTTDVVQANTTYTLTYYVGNNANMDNFAGYRALLVANGLVLTPTQSKPTPTAGEFVEAASTGYVSDDSEEVGYPISIVLEPLGGRVDFDDVTMDASSNASSVPEPASGLLGLIAVPLLAGRRRGNN